MYRALVELRALAAHLKLRSTVGVEACWVGSAIDLQEGDLTSDSGGSHEPLLLEHLRAVGLREAAGPLTSAHLKRLLRRLQKPAAEIFPGSPYERALCAVGAAMALKAAASQGVAIAYIGLSELKAAEWKRLLILMSQEALPLVIMALPGTSKIDLETLAVKSALSLEAAVPVVPVDAGDPVAIYRVAQETLVRARAGGGSAIVLGVACGTDAVALLGSQLLTKKICTERWLSTVEPHLKRMLTIH